MRQENPLRGGKKERDGAEANRSRRHLTTIVALLVVTVAACGGGAEPEVGDTIAPGPQSPGPGAVSQATSTTSPPGGVTTTVAPATTVPAETGSTAPGSPSTTVAPTTTAPATSASTSTTTAATVAPTSTTEAPPSGPFVRIGKDYYPFTPDDCYIFDGTDVLINGPGESSDGIPVWVRFDASMSSRIWAMRVDIGTDEPFVDPDDHWAAGVASSDDMTVTVDGSRVTATGTFVSGVGHPDTEGEFEAECG